MVGELLHEDLSMRCISSGPKVQVLLAQGWAPLKPVPYTHIGS